MASIRKEKKGTYTISVAAGINPATGKRATVKRRGFATLKEAKLAAHKIEASVSNGTYWQNKVTSTTTYKAMFEKWFKSYQINREPSTILKTERLFKNHFLPRFGEMDLTAFTTLLLHDYAVELVQNFKRGDYMFNYFCKPIQLAAKLDLIANDPTVKVERPRADRSSSKTDDFYEENELKLFLETSYELSSVNYKQYAFYRLIAMTGLRKQEICAINWADDLDFDNKTLSITKAVSRNKNNGLYIANRTKNKASTRIISIDDETLEVLKNWREEQQSLFDNWNEDFLVFCADRGHTNGQKILSQNTARSWRIKIQDLMDAKTGSRLKRIDTHGFRHTHITLLAQAGVSFKSIQKRVGHGDAKTTLNIYMHATQKADDELADILPNLLSKKDTEPEKV